MISHHHKALFVHIPKCGGQSIETMFLEDLGLDWETRAPLLLRPNDNGRLGPPRLAHLLAEEYLRFKYISEEQFAGYYKFAMIRCPYARAVSLYNHLDPKFGLDDFVTGWLPQEFARAPSYASYPHRYDGNYYFVRPQKHYLTIGDALLVDAVFDLKAIAEAAAAIRGRCGLTSQLKHVNKPPRRRASLNQLGSALRAKIAELYAEDFEFFGFDRAAIG